MNVCQFSNLLLAAIEYSLAGNTKDAIVNKEINLPELILVFCTFTAYFMLVFWWLIPIQYFINILHLNNIKFKCEKDK